MRFSSVIDHCERIIHHAGKTIKLGGKRYKLRGYFSNVMATRFQHEPFMTNVLGRILGAREGLFIDVGVNIGQTLIKVLHIDPNRSYLGFEPQIACCFIIDQFIKDNGLQNVKIVPIAVADKTATLKFYSNNEFDTMASLVGAVRSDGGSKIHETLVFARRLDDVLGEIGADRIAAVKIDVEGAELQVLQGMTKILSEKRPFVIFEVLPNFYGNDRKMKPASIRMENNARAAAISGLIKDHGYDLFSIDKEGEEMPISDFDLDDKIDYRGSDFIAKPRAG